MNSKIVAGVGNIYANEALFAAKINPNKPAKQLTLEQCHTLVIAIRKVLKLAIKAGGTTLRNFLNSEGKPGYFKQKLKVYGCEGLPCIYCKQTLLHNYLGNRSTVFCGTCQV